MSAYMVDREHIAYLLDAAMSVEVLGNGSHSLHWFNPQSGECEQLRVADYHRAAEVGQMLWNENRKSIEARYPDTVDDFCATAPGTVGETYVYGEHAGNPFAAVDVVQVLKACDCFAYQSCEHKGWKGSNARAFIESMRAQCIARLPGYAEAEWGAPKSYYGARR